MGGGGSGEGERRGGWWAGLDGSIPSDDKHTETRMQI